MKLKEAKAYALETLKLERDFVRTFGKLTATQTWLDAIAAAEAVAASLDVPEAALAITTPEEALATSVTEDMTVVEEPAEVLEVSAEVLEPVSVSTPLPGKVMEDSFIAFWEAEPDPIRPQPLDSLPELDAAWDTPSETATSAPLVIYPAVILLMMLWASV